MMCVQYRNRENVDAKRAKPKIKCDWATVARQRCQFFFAEGTKTVNV